MKKIIFVFLFSLIQFVYSQSNFLQFINGVNSATSDSEKTRLVDSFMVYARSVGIPYIEGNSANFIYCGIGLNIYLAGDMNQWNTTADKLLKLSNTNFFYITKNYELDARLDYKFVRDGTWILDLENPKTVNGGFGPNSELAMPNYIPPVEIKYYTDIPHGKLKDTTFYSSNLNNSRTVRVYTPPDYESTTDSFSIIIVHDGLEYVSLAQMNNVLDYLIANNQIEPIIAVFIPPINRTLEYAGAQMSQFTSFIMEEIIPYIDSRYRTKREAKYRAVAGASNGGNISLWLAYNHPEVFGNVAAQSSNVISSISNGFQNSPKLNLKVYLDIGTYDISSLIPLVRNLKTALESKGYELFYREHHEGHSWGNWRAHIDDFLKFFFPKIFTKVDDEKNINAIEGFKLYQNYPNPFNSSTTTSYELRVPSVVSLKVYDIVGREIATLVDEYKVSGIHSVILDTRTSTHATLSSGVYFYRLTIGNPSTGSLKGQAGQSFSDMKKMVLIR